MLEVVEHQQARLAERRDHVLEERPARCLLDAECLSHGGEHELRVGERREVDRDRAADLHGGGLCEARLADPAGARERHEAHVAAAQERSHGCELELAADQPVAVRFLWRSAWPERGIMLEDAAFSARSSGDGSSPSSSRASRASR